MIGRQMTRKQIHGDRCFLVTYLLIIPRKEQEQWIWRVRPSSTPWPIFLSFPHSLSKEFMTTQIRCETRHTAPMPQLFRLPICWAFCKSMYAVRQCADRSTVDT